MIHLTDEHPIGTGLHLRMATQTEVGITLHQHAAVYRAVWVVTGHAPLSQCLVLENVRLGLLLVTPDTNRIPLLHPQCPGHLVDVTAVWFMAVNAGHPSLEDAMMMRQGEFTVGCHVTLQACLRVGAGVNDVGCKARLDVFAASAVARLTPGHRCPLHLVAPIKPAVWTAVKSFVNLVVTLGAGMIAHEGRAGNLRRSRHRGRCIGGGCAGNQNGTEK